MEQKKQKTRIFDSKLFWIIISLLASLSIWTYVASTENSVVTQIFRGVQVEIVGEDTLRNSKNLIVTDVDTNSVRVEIRGPRRIVDALESDDLIAQIDVSKLSRAAFASMKYKLVYPDGVDTRNLAEVSYSPETVNFMVSNLNSVSIPVRGGYEGALADGYTAESPVFEPSTITVTGPDAYLKDVSYAWVSFGTGQNASSSYTEEAPFTLLNTNGDAVPTDYLTASEETVTATLPAFCGIDRRLRCDDRQYHRHHHPGPDHPRGRFSHTGRHEPDHPQHSGPHRLPDQFLRDLYHSL